MIAVPNLVDVGLELPHRIVVGLCTKKTRNYSGCVVKTLTTDSGFL